MVNNLRRPPRGDSRLTVGLNHSGELRSEVRPTDDRLHDEVAPVCASSGRIWSVPRSLSLKPRDLGQLVTCHDDEMCGIVGTYEGGHPREFESRLE